MLIEQEECRYKKNRGKPHFSFRIFVGQPRILSNIQEGVAADMRGGSQRGPTIDRNTGARREDSV